MDIPSQLKPRSCFNLVLIYVDDPDGATAAALRLCLASMSLRIAVSAVRTIVVAADSGFRFYYFVLVSLFLDHNIASIVQIIISTTELHSNQLFAQSNVSCWS